MVMYVTERLGCGHLHAFESKGNNDFKAENRCKVRGGNAMARIVSEVSQQPPCCIAQRYLSSGTLRPNGAVHTAQIDVIEKRGTCRAKKQLCLPAPRTQPTALQRLQRQGGNFI